MAMRTSFWLGAALCAISASVLQAASFDLPRCVARSKQPPVRGYLATGGQFNLDEGCSYGLWEGAQAAQCLQGAWFVVAGGSNSVLMTVQLANMLSPEAILPVRDGANMGGFTVVDVIIEGGRVIHRNASRLPGCSAERQDAACKAKMADLVAHAPAYSGNATRITLFEAHFWDMAATAVDIVEAESGWHAAKVSMLVQVSAWYTNCGIKKLPYCPREELRVLPPEFNGPTGEDSLQKMIDDMDPVMERLFSFCSPSGRAGELGCAIATASYGNTAANEVEWVRRFNGAIEDAVAPNASETLRLVGVYEMGASMDEEVVGGHGSPVLNLWILQVLLGGICPANLAATGRYASFEGPTCWGSDAGKFSKCPEYRDTCDYPGRVGNCEQWECLNSVPCHLVTQLTAPPPPEGVSDADVVVNLGDLLSGADPCERIWCDDELEWVPTLVAASLAVLVLLGANFGIRCLPQCLRTRFSRSRSMADKLSPDSSAVAGAACKDTLDTAAQEAEKSKSSTDPCQTSNGQDSNCEPCQVAVDINTEESNQQPAESKPVAPAEASCAAVAAEIPASGKAKGGGDKFPLGLARFCASIHVVIGHMYADGATPGIYFFGWGFTWVPWFFMLSGFVLFTAYLRRPKEESPFEYVLRRSVSIYPLYACGLLVSFAIAFSRDSLPNWKVIAAQSFLAQAWWPWWTEQALQGHCWFVSCMVVYWLCFKFLARCLKGLSLLATGILMMSLFALPWLVVIVPGLLDESVAWYRQHTYGATNSWLDIAVVILKFSPVCYAHVFVLGMLLAKLRLLLDAKVQATGLPRAWRLLLEFVAPLGYAGLVLVFSLEKLQPMGYKLSARLSVLLPLQAAILFGLAGIPSAPQPRVAAFASHFDFLERYSYAVYVFQFICHSVWPKSGVMSLPLFLIFVVSTAVVAAHVIQQPVQRLWAKNPRRAGLMAPLAICSILLLLSALPRESPIVEGIPREVRHDNRSVDVRLSIDDSASTVALINPSLLVRDGQVVLTARRHSLSYARSNNGTATFVDEIWHSDILLGTASLDQAAWAAWPTTGTSPFDASLFKWQGLSTDAGELWTNLCFQQTWIPENRTMIRHIVTGPEDAKVVSQGDSLVVAFNSMPPGGVCNPGESVSQMYMATDVDGSVPDKIVTGHRLDYGQKKVAEKNWIPFTNEGQLYYVYKPIPHRILRCESSGFCEKYTQTTYEPLMRLIRENPSWEVRGSGQAVLVKDPEGTPTLPRTHYLALLHIFDTGSGRYAHFAYRFSSGPPFEILQVSSQLPLLEVMATEKGKAFAFASGLAVQNRTVTISYGAGDRDARALVLTLDRLDEMFNATGSIAPLLATTSEGPIQSGYTLYLKGWTGKYITFEQSGSCSLHDNRGSWEAVTIEKDANGTLQSGDSVFFKVNHLGNYLTDQDGALHAKWADQRFTWQTFIVEKVRDVGNQVDDTIRCGDSVFLTAHTGMSITMEESVVHAAWSHRGEWQTFVLECAPGQ